MSLLRIFGFGRARCAYALGLSEELFEHGAPYEHSPAGSQARELPRADPETNTAERNPR
jgi:hypothetical protein